eukprot:GHVT01040245.1.p2 GENE.GHVT01040245.1~~GHVT01040245.1.p2  ORF type:complete len:189 (-),score=23.68 GHVT01040245.1:1734-2300(-)
MIKTNSVRRIVLGSPGVFSGFAPFLDLSSYGRLSVVSRHFQRVCQGASAEGGGTFSSYAVCWLQELKRNFPGEFNPALLEAAPPHTSSHCARASGPEKKWTNNTADLPCCFDSVCPLFVVSFVFWRPATRRQFTATWNFSTAKSEKTSCFVSASSAFASLSLPPTNELIPTSVPYRRLALPVVIVCSV